ncbi:MAG: hypothetical protein ABEH78_06820 [Haloferacaceae archaeon]
MSANSTGFDPLDVKGVSVVLLLLALPLTSFGTVEGPYVLWLLGLAFLVIGGVTTLVAGFVLDGRA